MSEVTLIECPRDAMQGLKAIIPTQKKINYMKSLLAVGFDTLDCGSFVSPKAIPQMADTAAVIEALETEKKNTKLLVIVANLRGAQMACSYPSIDVLGYPFSISENFQMRNTGKSIDESLTLLEEIISLSEKNQKELVVYLSMGFGNPYGDPWSPDIISQWIERLTEIGVNNLSLSDTIGCAMPSDIHALFSSLIPRGQHHRLAPIFTPLQQQQPKKFRQPFRGDAVALMELSRGLGDVQWLKTI